MINPLFVISLPISYNDYDDDDLINASVTVPIVIIIIVEDIRIIIYVHAHDFVYRPLLQFVPC